MVLHIIKITAISGVILLCIFYPYLPGSYDSLAVTLSVMAQVLGFAGVLMVPIGLLWWFFELMKRKNNSGIIRKIKPLHFATTAFIVFGLISLIVSLAAVSNDNLFLGISLLVLSFYILIKNHAKLRSMKNGDNLKFNPTPLYLVIIPVIVVVFRFIFIVPAVEFSRNYAMKQSEELIQDIEGYYKRNGHYPASLLSVWKDYKPSVTGIKQYHYEPSGDAYNLYFEQFSYHLDIKEIVMYNKFDEHIMTSHDIDLLELSYEELNLQRGYIGIYDLPNPHWKYFWFD